jgi:DNA-binding transcriptional regulator LsrR (DeoR family)
MKKIVDDERLIYKVCSLYYQDNMNQKEIGDYLGVSRSSVLRMLQKGRESGIVTIELHNPATYNYGKLEKNLENRFGLKDVVIVEESVLDTKDESAAHLFGQAADYLHNSFKEGDQIGVTMGQTLNSVVMTNKTFEKHQNLMFVPMVGGISQSTVDGEDVQGNEIARKFADKFGGTYTQFLSPAVFSNKMVLDYFLQEKAINYILDEFKKINVAVLGLGIPERADHTLLKAGYVTARELRMLADGGAVGDIGLQFFDKDGSTEKFKFFNERVAAMSLEEMKNIPVRIGIANGEKKAASVLGAIKGDLINVLITNAECARHLLDLSKEPEESD